MGVKVGCVWVWGRGRYGVYPEISGNFSENSVKFPVIFPEMMGSIINKK